MAEGSGRWESLAREFVDGTTIKWGALATLIVGSFYTEVVLGIVQFIGNYVATGVALLGAYGRGLGALIDMAVDIPVAAAVAGWASAANVLFSGWLGIGAPVFAVAIVLFVIYVYGEATINRVTEWILP